MEKKNPNGEGEGKGKEQVANGAGAWDFSLEHSCKIAGDGAEGV